MAGGTGINNKPEAEGQVTTPPLAFNPKFTADGLITAVATDVETGQLLMVAHMNADALAKTIETGIAHYWSRSRRSLWQKGATSGHIQKVREIWTDCDQDALQLIVEQTGCACHTGRRSCFYRSIENKDGTIGLVEAT